MKKQLKTKKLDVKTETVRNLTDKQLGDVAGGLTLGYSNQDTQKCVLAVH